MDDFQKKILRTVIELLTTYNMHPIASLLVDAEVEFEYSNYDFYCVRIDLPLLNFNVVDKDDYSRRVIIKAFQKVAVGHLIDGNGNPVREDFPIEFRIKLIDLEEDWKEKIKSLITNFKDSNQGVITEKIFKRENKSPLVYNEMKFASQSEIRIAQELEKQKVLFFPLPLGVRYETGNNYKDHREADFLICLDGKWGILEVSYHPNRFEQDNEKDTWFKKSGILCVQHYTAEKCYNESQEVVKGFIEILSKY